MLDCFATSTSPDADNDTLTVSFDFADDTDLACEVCDIDLSGRPAAYVADYPHPANSALTVCLTCLPTIAHDFRATV